MTTDRYLILDPDDDICVESFIKSQVTEDQAIKRHAR